MDKGSRTILADQNVMYLIKAMSNEETTEVMKTLAGKFNADQEDTSRIERLFQEHIEFDSRDELVRKLGGAKSSVLNVILIKLIVENKVMINDDGTLTWIYAADNAKLRESCEKATVLRPSKGLDG